MNRGAWRARVHGVAKSQIWLRRHVHGKAHRCFWLLTRPILQEGKLAKRLLLYHFSELTLEEWKECFPLWFFNLFCPIQICPQPCGIEPMSAQVNLYTGNWCVSCSVVSDSLQLMDCSPPGSSVHGILQARILSGLSCPSPGQETRQNKYPHLFALHPSPQISAWIWQMGTGSCLQPCQISLFLCPLSFSSLASLLSSLYRHH